MNLIKGRSTSESDGPDNNSTSHERTMSFAETTAELMRRQREEAQRYQKQMQQAITDELRSTYFKRWDLVRVPYMTTMLHFLTHPQLSSQILTELEVTVGDVIDKKQLCKIVLAAFEHPAIVEARNKCTNKPTFATINFQTDGEQVNKFIDELWDTFAQFYTDAGYSDTKPKMRPVSILKRFKKKHQDSAADEVHVGSELARLKQENQSLLRKVHRVEQTVSAVSGKLDSVLLALDRMTKDQKGAVVGKTVRF